jgi:hypothetical protein
MDKTVDVQSLEYWEAVGAEFRRDEERSRRRVAWSQGLFALGITLWATGLILGIIAR